jgi:hypothetical protein
MRRRCATLGKLDPLFGLIEEPFPAMVEGGVTSATPSDATRSSPFSGVGATAAAWPSTSALVVTTGAYA